jgi:hypothetical protein
MFAALSAAPPAPAENLTAIYLIYVAASIGLTAWLAVVLNHNGRTFLRDVFDDKPDMGEAVNRLLTIGFFMLNLGYAFLILRAEPTTSTEETVNFLANRLGLLLVSLGILHFVNMAVFARIRHRVLAERRPVAPTQVPNPPPTPPGPRATFVPAPDLPPPPPVATWGPPGVPR